MIVHGQNGYEEDADKFVEIDGKKFIPDGEDPTKAKVGEDGEPVPFKEEEKKGDKGDNGDDNNDDLAGKSLEDLAKVNPKVAKILEDQEDAKKNKEKEDKEKKDAEDEKAAKDGKWQELAEERKTKADSLQKDLDKNGEILGKYVNSVKEVLKNVIDTIPEENRGLVPEDFSPRQQLEYITKNQKLLGAKVSQAQGGKILDNDKTPTGTEEEELIKEIGEFQEKSQKGTLTEAESEIFFEKGKKLKELRTKKALKN